MIPRGILAECRERGRLSAWYELERSAGRRCASSATDVKKLEDVGGARLGDGAGLGYRGRRPDALRPVSHLSMCSSASRPPRLLHAPHRRSAVT
jgi:hypothetical protein